MQNNSVLEAILFVSPRPLSIKRLQQILGASQEEVEQGIGRLMASYAERNAGIRIQRNADQIQVVTAPDVHAHITDFLKEETASELTIPQLETLTILAYRGPLTKTEIEHIRGVNATIIIRNLVLRGLIEEGDSTAFGPQYRVTFDFLKYLGVTQREELPEYEVIAHDPIIDSLLAPQQESNTLL